MSLYDLIGLSFQTLTKDLLWAYTIFFTLYITYRVLRRLHYHYTKTFNFTMRILTTVFAILLFVGTIQASNGQDYFGQRVSAQYTGYYSPELEASFGYATGSFGLYEVFGDHTFEQSVSLIGYKGNGYLSGYAAWTYSDFVWQRLSASVTPLLTYNEYKQHFLDAKYMISVPFGDSGFHMDNVLGTKYFFDDNLNINYSPFLYYQWKDSGSGLFFNLGPRFFLNTYQERNPDYWSPELYYQVGPGAKLGMYGDPFTFVFDSFVGTSRSRSTVNGEEKWERNNNLYLSFRTSYSFENNFDLFGRASWASSRNINSPINFSEFNGTIGLAYNF